MFNNQKFRRQKNDHKNLINYFDIYSNNVTVNGILASDDQWKRDQPNQDNQEKYYFYGSNSKNQTLILKFEKMLANESSPNEPHLHYNSYHLKYYDSLGELYSTRENAVMQDRTNSNVIRFAGLTLQVIEPFRRWRIAFSGYLRNNHNELVFYRIRLIWLAVAQLFDYNSNFDQRFMKNILHNSGANFEQIFENRLVQCGQMKGTIQVEDQQSCEIYLWGARIKVVIDDVMHKKQYDKSFLIGYSQKGVAFEVQNICNSNSTRYGFVSTVLGYVHPIEYFKTIPGNDDDYLSISYHFRVKAKNKFYEIKVLEIHNQEICKLSINGQISAGVLLEDSIQFEFIDAELSVNLFSSQLTDDLVVSLDDSSAKNERIAGGKGSSLSVLTSLSRANTSNGFAVANGFVVTTNAYRVLLSENVELSSAIDKLQNKCWYNSGANLREDYARVKALFYESKLPLRIKIGVKEMLKRLYKSGDNYNHILFAIRSSAVGEDSPEMSSAGQMETFLGVKGFSNICDHIIKCWSSQFSTTAVEYKRRFGQLINSPMAVVVQQMIDCDVSGVMFTCDPITGDQRKIVINANHGLGVSVVSASVTPDTITISVNIKSNSHVRQRLVQSIDSVVVGAKRKIVKMSSTQSEGTEEFAQNNGFECSLSNQNAIRLAQIGLTVYSGYGCALDIEWGFSRDKCYLFQCRPVTGIDSPSEWELLHELDTGHNDECGYHSRANVGEILPGAVSPLTLTTIVRQLGVAQARQNFSMHKTLPIFYRKPIKESSIDSQTFFLDLKEDGFFRFAPEEQQTFDHKAIVLSIFGHLVDDAQLNADCFERFEKQSLRQKLRLQAIIVRNILRANNKMRTTIKKYNRLDVMGNKTFDSSKDMVQYFLTQLYFIVEVNHSTNI